MPQSVVRMVLRQDPVVFAVTLVGLAVSGVLAAVAPARRASRVDPIVTLRCE